MADLSETLVTDVAKAIQGAAYGKAALRKARLAVVATLRGLADAEQGPWFSDEFNSLADHIEQGDTNG